MHADRLRLDAGHAAIDGDHRAFPHQAQHPLCDLAGVVQHRARFPAGDQRALRRIGAIGKGLGDDAQAGIARPAHQRRAGQRDQHQFGVDRADGCDHVARLAFVAGDGVVQRAMRLDVAHRRADRRRHAGQRADLIDDVGNQVFARHVHVAAAEALQVGIRDMRAHRDTARRGGLQRPQDASGIAGVEAAGHVGAADDVEDRRIAAHAPGAEALAEIAVQVDLHGVGPQCAGSASPTSSRPWVSGSSRQASTTSP